MTGKGARAAAAALVMVLCLTACGKSASAGGGNVGGDKSTDSASVPAGSVFSDETPAENAGEAQQEETLPELRPLTVTIESAYTSSYDQDNSCLRAISQVETVSLSEADSQAFPALASALAAENDIVRAAHDETFRSFIADYESGGIPDADMYRQDSGTLSVMRADSRVLSYVSDYYWFGGGVHPDVYYECANFDTASGKALDFFDVVTDVPGFFDLMEIKLEEEYPGLLDLMDDFDAYRQELEDGRSEIRWTIDSEGVTVYFNTYILGPYAAGRQVIRIGFDEAAVFDPYYTETPETYIIPFLADNPLYADIDGDGQREKLALLADYSDPYHVEYAVACGEKTVPLDGGGYDAELYLVYDGGCYYVYAFVTGENDYSVLHAVDAAAGRVAGDDRRNLYPGAYTNHWEDTETGYISCHLREALTNPAAMLLMSRTDMMGTQEVMGRYAVGTDGAAEALEDWYRYGSTRVLTARTDIPCIMVDADGRETGSAVIPAGTTLAYARTDNESWVDFAETTMDDVTTYGEGDYVSYEKSTPPDLSGVTVFYRLTYDSLTYPRTIGGVEETTLLGGLMYAG